MTDYSHLPHGTRVRGVVEGTIDTRSKPPCVRVKDNGYFYVSRFESLEVIHEPEPQTLGSVVLDKDGHAWQRRQDRSHAYPWAFGSTVYKTWEQLNNQFGPVTIIHTPKES